MKDQSQQPYPLPRLLFGACRSAILLMLSGAGLAAPARAEEAVPLAPMVVTATRAPRPARVLPFTVDVFSAADLGASPSLTLDDTLRSSAAFSLFRRSGSLTANPTAQGVSLRGIGPSGASRALVLLDGVPLNDPFGGWVAWSAVPRADVDRVELVRGGGSGAWGSAALGGTLQLLSRPPDADTARAEAMLGDFSTRSAAIGLTRVGRSGAVRVDAEAFSTGGAFLVRNPGAIDRPADSNHQRVQADLQRRLSPAVSLTVTGRYFAEERGNGTPLQANRTRAGLVSATLNGTAGPDTNWSAVGYAQQQTFESFFTAVNAARSAETPANHQFDVPATAAGAAFTWVHAPDRMTTTLGADVRWVEGETREDFSFSVPTGLFTRRRVAGGQQLFAGAFGSLERELAPGLRATLGARGDLWRNSGGHRRETDLATGAATRDDRYADRHRGEFSPTAGLVWQPAEHWRVRAVVYRAFRLPTLNEYYRPFRVGSAVTEANPALGVETLDGGELGVDLGTARAGVTATGFINELNDAVANVTLARGPGTFPLFGFLPAGGVGRQRLNLDRIRVRGLELSAHAELSPAVRLKVDYLLNDGRVAAAGAAPGLVGRRLAQVPRQTLVAGVSWRAPAEVQLNARLRWVSAQFEDDENTLSLAPAMIVDLGLSRPVGSGGQIFLAVENLFSAQVETGRTADGVVNIAPPRFARAGVRWHW